MKKLSIISFLALITLFLCIPQAKAQLLKNQYKASDYSGRVVKKPDPSKGAKLGNLFNMKMSQSYSMMFASMGGQYQNLNAFTNTMQFFFTDRLTGRVDLSLLHSPFGGAMNGFGQANKGVQFIIRNAELNYDLSKNSSLHVQFNQVPAGYGYGMYPGYYNNPFRSNFLIRH